MDMRARENFCFLATSEGGLLQLLLNCLY